MRAHASLRSSAVVLLTILSLLLLPARVNAQQTPAAAPAGEEAAPDTEPAPVEGGAQETVPAATVEKHEPPMLLLGLGAGVYIPTSDLEASFLLGVDATYQLPWLGGRFGVGAGFAYSQPTTSGTIQDDRVPGDRAEYHSVMHEMVLDLRVTFRVLDWKSIWSPYVGLGPVFYFLQHTVDSLGNEQTEGSNEVGGMLLLGADLRLWHGGLVCDVRVPLAPVDQRTTGESNLGAVSVMLGYRFRI